MSEKDLITKYVPSYVSPGNPSSWTSVSNFDAFEIINNPETVYGLLSDQREEVSRLIKMLENIALASKINLVISPKLTIHMLYDQVRSAVASADTREQK